MEDTLRLNLSNHFLDILPVFLILIGFACIWLGMAEQAEQGGRCPDMPHRASAVRAYTGFNCVAKYTLAGEKPAVEGFVVPEVPAIPVMSVRPAPDTAMDTAVAVAGSVADPVTGSVADPIFTPTDKTDVADSSDDTFAVKYPDFALDASGNLVSYSGGGSSVVDGLFVLPSHEDCTGITAEVFAGLEEEITELFIPANITYLAPGALDKLTNLIYIQVLDGNPAFYSERGILYYTDGSTAAVPKGRIRPNA